MRIPRLIFSLFILLTAFIAAPLLYADDLGRLFLTPSQRQALDKIRYEEPVEMKAQEVVIEEIPEPEPEMERPDIGGIYVNGLVYRENGKSTAWVNRATTNEGDFGHRYLEIDEEAIKPDEVEIKIPSARKRVKLKVGEFYEPGVDGSE